MRTLVPRLGLRLSVLLGGPRARPRDCVIVASCRQFKVYAVPLNKHVTIVAKGYEVLNEVRIICYLERRYWSDVMNVERFTKS